MVEGYIFKLLYGIFAGFYLSFHLAMPSTNPVRLANTPYQGEQPPTYESVVSQSQMEASGYASVSRGAILPQQAIALSSVDRREIGTIERGPDSLQTREQVEGNSVLVGNASISPSSVEPINNNEPLQHTDVRSIGAAEEGASDFQPQEQLERSGVQISNASISPSSVEPLNNEPIQHTVVRSIGTIEGVASNFQPQEQFERSAVQNRHTAFSPSRVETMNCSSTEVILAVFALLSGIGGFGFLKLSSDEHGLFYASIISFGLTILFTFAFCGTCCRRRMHTCNDIQQNSPSYRAQYRVLPEENVPANSELRVESPPPYSEFDSFLV